MNEEQLIAVLEDAGLSPYQAEAYVSLIELGTASATEVAEASGVPDPRIYDVLRDLEEEGYVETFQQDTLTARANDPLYVTRDLESRSSQFLDAADAIEDRWNQPAVEDHDLTVVKRFETVLERTKQRVRDAERQVTAALPLEQFPSVADALAGAHENGALVRVTVSASHPDEEVPDPSLFQGTCAETRFRLTPSPFLVIADRTWMGYMPIQQNVPVHGLLVNDGAYASVFQWIFATVLWADCDVIYREEIDEFPRSYVDIRRCLADLKEPVAAGATVEVVVDGTHIDTGERLEVGGTVRSIELGWNETGDVDPMARPSGPLSLTFETDDGTTYDVGGWGAILEDIEATRITVTDVSHE